MRISHTLLPTIRSAVILVFFAACAVVFGYLWVNSGGRLPLVSGDGYRVSVDIPKVANLVHDSDVMIAGVKVGKVDNVEIRGDKVRVRLRMDEVSPLHEGATVQVRQKSLVEETFVEVTDGRGPALPAGTQLPPGSGKPLTKLDDVLASLDPKARQALARGVRDLGASTGGTRSAVSDTFSGLGDLGRNGKTVLDALNAQSDDLAELSGQTAAVLASLNAGRGEIATMVRNANRLATASAAGRQDIERVMRKLPGTLDAAREASGPLRQLGGDVRPIARDLRGAAPALSAALRELPATTRDLRGLLPALDGVLDSAPATLRRLPRVAEDLSALAPVLRADLADINPMLRYLKPYGPDIAAFFTNWGQTFANSDVNGHYLRLFMVFNEQSIKGIPLDTNVGPLNKKNPYPSPGQSSNPGPWQGGEYPRVEREGG